MCISVMVCTANRGIYKTWEKDIAIEEIRRRVQVKSELHDNSNKGRNKDVPI